MADKPKDEVSARFALLDFDVPPAKAPAPRPAKNRDEMTEQLAASAMDYDTLRQLMQAQPMPPPPINWQGNPYMPSYQQGLANVAQRSQPFDYADAQQQAYAASRMYGLALLQPPPLLAGAADVSAEREIWNSETARREQEAALQRWIVEEQERARRKGKGRK